MRAVAIFQLDRCYQKMFMPARLNMYKITIPYTVICLSDERNGGERKHLTQSTKRYVI